MSLWLPHLYGRTLAFGTTQFAFLTLFTSVILLVPRHATIIRFSGLAALSTLTYMLQETFIQWCENPHWRATAVPFFWIQFLSASELILVSRVKFDLVLNRGRSGYRNTLAQATQSIALLWNLRRIGTRWQVKNVPASSSSGPASWSRSRFVLKRLTTTFFAYLVLEIMISGPTPDSALISPQKATLFNLGSLSMDDLVFRIIATVSFWLSTALLNLVMSNSVAIFSVLFGLSSPADCPRLYGSIGEAYSVRQFWG